MTEPNWSWQRGEHVKATWRCQAWGHFSKDIEEFYPIAAVRAYSLWANLPDGTIVSCCRMVDGVVLPGRESDYSVKRDYLCARVTS